jgi:hypothetical protein
MLNETKELIKSSSTMNRKIFQYLFLTSKKKRTTVYILQQMCTSDSVRNSGGLLVRWVECHGWKAHLIKMFFERTIVWKNI